MPREAAEAVDAVAVRCWNCAAEVPNGAASCLHCAMPVRGRPAATRDRPREPVVVEPPPTGSPGAPLFAPPARPDDPPSSAAPPVLPAASRQAEVPPENPGATGLPDAGVPLFGPGPATPGAAGQGRLFAPVRGPGGRGSEPAPAPSSAPGGARPSRSIDVGGAPTGPTTGGPPGAPPPGPPPPGAPPPGAAPPPLSGSTRVAAPGSPPAAPGGTPPPTGAAPPGQQAPGAGRIVGRVDGDISLDTENRSLRGVQVFIVAALAALAIVIVRATGAVLHNLPALLSTLLPLVLTLLFLFVIFGAAFGSSPRSLLGGAGRATRRAASTGAGAAARGVAAGVRTGARAGSSSGGLTASITVRRFRVKALAGEIVPCVQQGDLVGDEVRHGDYVLLEGRRTRDGHMLLSRVDVLQTPSGPVLAIIRTRSGLGHSAALVADRVCLVLGLALAAFVVLELVRMVL